jgi:aryl-alcohol dehydrogenase-like predicted oxidoreductase
MQKVNIPKTELYASTLGLGSDYFGSSVDRELSMQLMDSYFEAGGNVIDTAEFYARWVPGGEHQSEKVIGEWLHDRRVRDQVILSTKGAHPKLESMDVPRMSKAEIQADLDSSLQRLGVERVDLYWLHRDAPGYPVEEILETLEAFRQAGKIRYAGFSNWNQARAEEARQAAQRLHLQGFVASQNMWSLAKADLAAADPTWAYIDESFVQWHIEHGFAAFPYLTQANGYFRRLEQNTLDRVPADARVRTLFDHQENRERFKRLRRLQEKYDLSVGKVVLGYLTGQPLPVFPLVGPKTLADLQDSLHGVETKLSEADIFFLERGGECEARTDQPGQHRISGRPLASQIK